MPLKLTTYYRGSKIPELPGNNTFHSTGLFRIYEATPGYTPVLIVASENDKPIAKLLAVIRKSVRMFPPGIIKRCEVYGTGEYFDDNADKEAIFNDMLQRLTDEALREAFLIEFRNLENALFGYKSFRENSYFAVNWLRVRNSLHSIEKVEERFSPSRIRQVKKGLKNGAQVRETQTMEETLHFAHMLRHIYSSKIRRHFPASGSSNTSKADWLKDEAKSSSSPIRTRLSGAVPASTPAIMPTSGSPAECARPMPCNIRAFWPYGKRWTMPNNTDIATWNLWMSGCRFAGTDTATLFFDSEGNKAAPGAGSVFVGTG